MPVGGTGSSLVQTTGGCCSCGPVKKPPLVVTSDQSLFDPGTSTSGLSSGMTVRGSGSSLVQTTGEAAQRVHLPEVPVTIETLIYPVQIFTVQVTENYRLQRNLLFPPLLAKRQLQ